MFRSRNFLCTAAALCLAALPAAGQQDCGFVLQTNPHLQSANAALLTRLGVESLSTAVISATKENGGLMDIGSSADSFTGGAQAQTYNRLSERTVFYGGLSYSNFQGKQMGGPVLMDPDFNPFGLLEDNSDTAGSKKRELYAMQGALAYSLTRNLAIGGRLDYLCGDQTKVKDPRFSNILKDMDLSLGLDYAASESLDAGFNLRYRNSVEQIMGGLYGDTDRTYFIIRDRGWFFGTREGLGGDSGIVSTQEYRPVNNTFCGAGLQIDWRGSAARVFVEAEILARNGYYGRKTSTSPVYYEWSGAQTSLKGKILLPRGERLSLIDFNLGYNPVNNRENTFTYTTEAGKNTVVNYTGQKQSLSRTDLAASAGYTFFKGTGGYRPEFKAGGALEYAARNQRTTVTPFYRTNSYSSVTASAFCEWNLARGKNIFSPGATLLLYSGSGNRATDGSYSGGTSTTILSFDNWLDRQFEYLTASRAGAALSFTYTRLLPKGRALQVTASDRFVSLLSKPEYLDGSVRNIATLAVGINL